MPASPEYQLYSESTKGDQPGRWRFVLRASDGSDPLVAEDVEPDVQGERLELLSVVRGLEALDQPSRVTLMTPSVYVREGIRYGLEEWRSNDWQWESFGRMVPVKNGDLWQRVDRAMGFHEVECHTRRFDPPHQTVSPPHNGDSGIHQNRRRRPWLAYPSMAASGGRVWASNRPPSTRIGPRGVCVRVKIVGVRAASGSPGIGVNYRVCSENECSRAPDAIPRETTPDERSGNNVSIRNSGARRSACVLPSRWTRSAN